MLDRGNCRMNNELSFERLRERAEQLKSELDTGQTELKSLMAREAFLRDTLLRISGALQVLEEFVGRVSTSNHDTISRLRGQQTEQAVPDREYHDGRLTEPRVSTP